MLMLLLFPLQAGRAEYSCRVMVLYNGTFLLLSFPIVYDLPGRVSASRSYIHMYIQVHIHTYIRCHVYLRYVHIIIIMYVEVHACTYILIRKEVRDFHVCVHTYTHLHIHTYIHIYMRM